MDIKRLSIEVTSKGLRETTNELGRLTKAAAQIDPVINLAQKSLNHFSGAEVGKSAVHFQSVATSLQKFKEGAKEVGGTVNGFKNLSATFTALATASEKLATTVGGLTSYNQILEKIKDSLQGIKSVGGLKMPSAPSGGGSTPAEGSSSKEESSRARLLAQLEREAFMVNHTKAEWLEYQAAKKGISAQAAPFISAMKNSEAALGRIGLSAKQTRAALNQVPAQFTDIVTQLAGGQNPFLIMIQQGGQLRDIFGGFGNMFRNVGSLVLKFITNPFVLAAGAVGSFAAAMYLGGRAMTQFGQATALTGNFIGLTSTQFADMSRNIADSAGGMGKAEAALIAIAESGKIAGNNVAAIATASAKFASVTGQDISKVVDNFAKLSEKPADGLIELNKQYHFLTLATYSQVKALEEQGKTQEAVNVAQKAFVDATNTMTTRVTANLGTVERAWLSIKNAVSGVKDAVLEIGRDDRSKQLKAYETEIARLEKIAALEQQRNGTVSEFTKQQLAVNKAQRDSLSAVIETSNVAAANAKADQTRTEAAARAYESLSASRVSSLDREKKAQYEIAKIERQRQAILADPSTSVERKKAILEELDIEGQIKKIREDSRDKGAASASDRLSSLRAELEAQKQNLAAVKQYSFEADKVTENEKKLLTVRQQIESGTGSKKLNDLLKEKSLLEEIVSVEKQVSDLNKEADRIKAWADMKKWVDATNISLQEQLDYLIETGAVQDKRTEIERKLAAATLASVTAKTQAERDAAKVLVEELKILNAKDKQVESQKAINKTVQEEIQLRAKYSAEYVSLQEAQRNEIEWAKLSNFEREKAQSLFQIEIEKRQRISELMAEQAILAAQGKQAEADALNKLIRLEEERAAKRSGIVGKKQRPAKEGDSVTQDATAAFENFYDSLQTRQQLFQEAFSNSFSLMTGAVEEFANTGKFNFKEFAVSALKMIQQVIVKLLVMKAIQAASSSFGFSSGGTFGGTTSTGGTSMFASGGAFTNSVVTRPTAFKFADGGQFKQGVMGEAGPEAIIPLAKTSSGELGVKSIGGDSSGDINITVIVNPDGSTSVQGGNENTDMKQLGRLIGDVVKAKIIEEKRVGGLLAN